jgi:RimJ/RimL family protein N-acetyltransferase
MAGEPFVGDALDLQFRTPVSDDIAILSDWLTRPHVRRWWKPKWTEEVLAALASGGEPPAYLSPFIVELDGNPVGYIQSYEALADPSGFWVGVETITEGTRGIDLLIGKEDLTNRRLGREIARRFIAGLFEDPAVDRIVADPHLDNWPCTIALKRIGFRDRGRFPQPGVNAQHLSLARAVFKG